MCHSIYLIEVIIIMTPCKLTILITLFANFISKNKTNEDLELLVAASIQFAYTLETIILQRKRLENQTTKSQNIENTIITNMSRMFLP